MAQHIGPTHIPASVFSRLSTDLKLEVFDVVRSKIDQGNARLVSREWNHLIKPRMWRTFTTNLRGTSVKDFETLVNGKNDCLQDIRELNVDERHLGSDYYSNFRRFMDLLGDNQLVKFKSSKEGSISSRDLLCLLRRQSNLRGFSALLNLSDISTEDRASWVTGQTRFVTSALHALRSLRVYVRDRPNENEYDRVTQEIEMACTRLFISSASLLRDLEICGSRHTWIDRVPLTALFGDSANPTHVPSTLRRLLFSDMNFCGRANELLGTINVATVHSLKLCYCDGVAPFISALAASFRQTGTQLKVLTVRTGKGARLGDNEGLPAAVDSLLSSFTGLEELEIDFMFCNLINWKESLRFHQENLKSLLIASDLMYFEHGWWAQIVEKIVEKCSHVEQFAYVPADPCLGKVEDCELSCSLDSSLHETLNAVAGAPSIHVLRLLYVPGLTDAERDHRQERDWAEKARLMVQNFATQVLRHLADRGSNVRLLAISPVSQWKQDQSDINGHYYPHYYYRRKIAEVDGKGIVDAVPFRACLAESPNATILKSF
ncbi:hypothetical protein V2W45_1004383 [Cenococcum geophilum]